MLRVVLERGLELQKSDLLIQNDLHFPSFTFGKIFPNNII